jgi:FeS assembly SUF system regulator
MLRISRLTDYATVILATADIALRTHLGVPTVSKLLKELQHAGLVRSVRGAHGGYQLAKPSAEINAADIIDAVEGPVALTECANGAGQCGIEATCQVGHGWQRISLAIHHALREVSLEELVRREGTLRMPALQQMQQGWRPLVRG